MNEISCWKRVAPAAILSAIRGALLRLRQVAPVVGRRAVQRPTATVEEARVQSAPLHCTTLASVHPLPTAASAAVLRGCCRSLSGGHGRLNWFVGKTRSYLCHRDTEFFRLQKPEVVKGCREEQATLGQLAAAGGVGRHGHPGNLWTLLILWTLVNLFK